MEDPLGFIAGLASYLGRTPQQVYADCVACAQANIQLGAWRLFLVDEVFLGKRQQRLMACQN
jgi:6-phosphogluconolactonase/glucosamine-6-phosphate isomerase/deaminase